MNAGQDSAHSKREIANLVRRGNRRQASDDHQALCYLGDHQIGNGEYYVEVKFTGGPRYAVCFPCANQHNRGPELISPDDPRARVGTIQIPPGGLRP